MDNLLAARSQMAMSLAFHIIFAAVGIAMPLLMVLAEWFWLRRGDEVWLILAKRWAKGTAILFAVGAVSGTVLSFELGLLWPKFMEFAGPLIGMPFSLEGFAFFLEAIFLGIYLYGWKKVSPWMHWWSGVLVAASGAISGIFVVMANGWMNAPSGFMLVNGQFTQIDPIAAMFNAAAPTQALHMTLAAYAAVGFAVAAIHFWMLARDPQNLFHRRALTLALGLGALTALLQPVSGDLSARMVARTQPAKLAAMEAQFDTERGAPLRIGGWPDEKAQRTRFALEIPYALSLLVHHDPQGEIKGLKAFAEHPPVAVVHLAFQIMVACGTLMMVTGLWWGWLMWRKKDWVGNRYFRTLVILCGPLGFVAIEAGWVVTEVGRQPWIIHGVMRTREAVTSMPYLVVPFVTFTILYCFLAFVVVFLLRRQVFESPRLIKNHGGES